MIKKMVLFKKSIKLSTIIFMLLISSILVSSARLPIVDSDLDNWGNILNDYLRINHDVNGSINTSTNAVFNSNVGIGTSSPLGVLQVVGDEVRIGNSGIVDLATGDGDLYVEDLLEVDGTSRLSFLEVTNHITLLSQTSQLRFTNPQIVITGNEDNAGQLRFYTGGIERIRIANGVTQMFQLLDINADLDISGNFEVETGVLFVNSTSGNIGIGTSSPDALTHIQSAVSINRAIQPDALLIVENNADAGIQIITPSSNIGSIFFGDIDADIGNIQYNHITNEMRFTTNNAPRLTIQSDGDVGIGTTSPNVKLEVFGAGGSSVGGFASGVLHVTDPSASVNANAVITGHNSFGGNKQLWYVGSTSSSNDNIAFINRQNANLQLNTNNLARLTILADGKIGIGKTNPSFELDVAGTIKATNYQTDAGAGFTGSCGSTTTLTVQDGIIVGCS